MKKKFLLLSGIVVLSFSAKAQELRENYMVWPDSKGIADYVTKWTPGTPLFEDENFYISRVKPKKRFRNSATQINESLTEANDRKLVFWVPIGQVTGGNVNARPDGEFDSEVFSTWSYVTHYGDWTSPHGWVPGGFADVAHKNGVGVSGVASIPNSGISTSDGAWGQALHKQVILDNEKFAKFLHYHGVDGLGYNSEFSGMSDDLPALHTQHELIHKYLVEQGNHLAENFWYDGTNDTGGITWDGGISSHNKETFGNGDHIRTSLFLNYNWWRSQVLSSISNIQNVAPGRSSLDQLEYEPDVLEKANCVVEYIEDEEAFNGKIIQKFLKKHRPDRIIIEYNGMWPTKHIPELYDDMEEICFDREVIFQTIDVVNDETFALYMKNMPSMMVDQFRVAEMIIINRCTVEKTNKNSIRGSIKAVNPRAQIVYESAQDEFYEMKDQMPFDVNADVIEISDDDFGLWYIDMIDHPETYQNKTLKVTGLIQKPKGIPAGFAVFGRFAMTCCADDVQYMGFLCKADDWSEFKTKQYVTVTARFEYKFMKEYGEEGPVFYAEQVEAAEKPKEELVYFN